MKRDYKLYLEDIKDCIRQIKIYLYDISEQEFNNNKLIQDAVIRRLEVIGEASRNIPRSLKEKNKQVPWFQMSQFRDIISHAYFEVGLKKVWNAATEELKTVEEAISKMSFI